MAKKKPDLRKGSEYGGLPGLVQPEPHVPSASERLMGLYDTDSADPDSGPTYPLVP